MFRLVLPLPFPGLDRVNAYLFASHDGATLVDCGIHFPDPQRDHGWDDLVEALGVTGHSPQDVTRLVVTHPHIDHYGMAARLHEETGCEVWMHRRAEEDIDVFRDPAAKARRLREMLADHGVEDEEADVIVSFEDWRPFLSGIVAPTHPLDGGERFESGARTWEVVHTPGHSPAHICLFAVDDRLLASGDHLLGTITPHIDFRRGDRDPLGEFLASLEVIEDLDPALVLPGHGRPFEDGADRARAVIRHHERRLGAILQVVRHEPHTADEITDELFGTTLLNFERRLALGEALAHLAYLRARDEIERVRGDDGKYRYRKVSRRRPREDDD